MGRGDGGRCRGGGRSTGAGSERAAGADSTARSIGCRAQSAGGLTAVLLSNSVSLVADLLLSLLDFATVLVVWWVARLAVQDRSLGLEYGFGKVESLPGAAVGIFMLISLGIVVALALARLQSGMTQIEGPGIAIGLAANGLSCVINSWLLLRYWRQARSDQSPVVRSQVALFVDKLTSNVVMIVALAGSIIFAGQPLGAYIDPIASLLIAASMGYWSYLIMQRALGELLDAACGEDVQMPVTQALARHFDDYDGLGALRTRRAGSQIFVEVELAFTPERTVAEVHRLQQSLSAMITQSVPAAEVVVLPRLLSEANQQSQRTAKAS